MELKKKKKTSNKKKWKLFQKLTCVMEKSVFDALKWLLLENLLFLSLSKKNIMCPLCSENSLLRVLSKKLSSPFLCSTILYDSPLFFFYGISCFFFLMHMDIESECMWLTLETSLRCSRVLFGKWSSMLTFLSKQKKLSHRAHYMHVVHKVATSFLFYF